MKNVIITGASGLVATELTLHLLSLQEYNLYLLSTNPSKLVARYKDNKRVLCFTLEDFKKYNSSKDIEYHCLINAAFARSSEGDKLAEALQYTYDLMTYATLIKLRCFVNISSQSVYGHLTEPLWTEQSPCAPDYMYALGKYTTELLLYSILGNSGMKYTNIRLSSVCENARFMNVFCKNALSGIPIKLSAPEQIVSFIDVRDVAQGLIKLIGAVEDIDFQQHYNLGTNECYTIRDVAYIVKEVAETEYNLQVSIIEETSDNNSKIGMDSTLFYQTFGWKPNYDIKKMISSLFKYNKNGGVSTLL